MEQLTLFDALNDKTFWHTTWCTWCNKSLPTRAEMGENEIIIRSYVGQHGHLVFIGFHPACYLAYAENQKQMTKIFSSI